MASPTLEDQLQRLTVNERCEVESLPFRPPSDIQRQTQFDEIPRYLFRVCTPCSQGTTTSSWVESMEARNNTADSRVDIFARTDRQEVARMINRHLRWMWNDGDNLVSWTSSLLVAVVYFFNLRAKIRHGLTFEQINLCIVDTSTLPDDTFIRDLDLIQCYSSHNESLRDFERLRSKQRRGFFGYYYFGEYLSQGALTIEGNCQIISAQALIDRGLLRIRPEFEELASWTLQEKPKWANPVIELRETFYASKTERPGISKEGVQAALIISKLFAPRWRLFVAASLIALAPPRRDDGSFLALLRRDVIAACPLSRLMTVTYDTLPEVHEASVIIRSAHKDYRLETLKKFTETIESSLRLGMILLQDGTVNQEDILEAEQDFPCADLGLGDVLEKLDEVQHLCDLLKSKMPK